MYHFILNPASRSGIAKKIWDETIEPYLLKENIPFLVHYSQGTGDIISLMEEITRDNEEISKIIIMGGDGAINEAIQGIHDFSKVHLGLIPIGSSNDLTRDMPHFVKDPIDNLKMILSVEKPLPMDYGTVTFEDGSSRNFVVSCGIGFDAAVCEEANRSKAKSALNKVGLGKLVYLCIALKQIFSAKLTPATLIIDGQEPKKINRFRFIACMNHPFEGGGFQFAPDANATDGIFELCEVGDIPTGQILFALPSSFKGKHYRYNGIYPHKASSFIIKTDAPQWVHTDGEVSKQSSQIQISCHEKELLFLYS